MKKAKIIANGNMNFKNLNSKGIISSEETWESKNLAKLVKQANTDHLDFAVMFYLWAKTHVHPVPTGGYRLQPEEYKEKRDLRYVVKYFEEKVYNGKN